MNITIEHAQEAKEQDIFFPGNCVAYNPVEYESLKFVVMVVENQDVEKDDHNFAGVIIYSTAEYNSGHFSIDWDKGSFKQFHGKIILEKA